MTRSLVFLHGVGGSAGVWAPQEAAFSPVARVLCWNAPGYGGRALPQALTFDGLAEQLMRDLDAFGIARATLIGHSFGGMVAQQAVCDFADRVEALVLSGTSAAFGNPDGDFQRRFVAERLAPLERGLSLADMAAELVDGIVGTAPDAAGVALAKAQMALVPAQTYRAVIRLIVGFDLRASLGAIACPTCLIAGEHDTNAPAAMMERLAGRIAGSEYAVIPGAGHLANLEQPGAFNAILEEFLGKPQHA
jgi:pimeloyl-ACP methyl ester carboxylesterase